MFDQLISVGRRHNIKLAGAYAADSLRLEKGFLQWGCELDTETTPLEAGLSSMVDMTKVRYTHSILYKVWGGGGG